jgi:uncharacterized protein (DUF433 family)
MEPAVLSDPEIMGGTPCLAGTRVPLLTLLEYVEGGESLDHFLIDFPSVPRALAESALRQSGLQVLPGANTAR